MKKVFNKIKAALATLWISLISFFSKVIGQNFELDRNVSLYGVPYTEPRTRYSEYGVPYPLEEINQTPTLIDIITKIAPRLLIPVTLAFGIISFLKIRKIDDEVLKKKKTKKAIIVITILIIITLLLFARLAIGIKKINFSVSFGDF